MCTMTARMFSPPPDLDSMVPAITMQDDESTLLILDALSLYVTSLNATTQEVITCPHTNPDNIAAYATSCQNAINRATQLVTALSDESAARQN